MDSALHDEVVALLRGLPDLSAHAAKDESSVTIGILKHDAFERPAYEEDRFLWVKGKKVRTTMRLPRHCYEVAMK
jgi:hypothetical protein